MRIFVVVLLNVFLLGRIVLTSGSITECPAGTTSAEGPSLWNRFLRVKCEEDTRYLKTEPIRLTQSFTLQVWIKHLPCPLKLTSGIRTILYQGQKFAWTYNANANRYNFTIWDSAERKEISDSSQPVVTTYNKWLHLTIVNSDSTGLKMLLNGKTTILSTGHFSGGFFHEDPIYIGTYDPIEMNRFSGYIREFRVWEMALTENEIAENYDRELDHSDYNTIPGLTLYLRLDYNYASTDEHKLILRNSAHQLEYGDDDPICCRLGQDCTKNRFNGITCETDHKSLFFDGAYYLPTISMKLPDSERLFLSFWFKFVRTSRSLPVSTILTIDKVFSFVYDKSVGDDDLVTSQSQIVFKSLQTGNDYQIAVPRQATLWTLATFEYDFSGSASFKFRVHGSNMVADTDASTPTFSTEGEMLYLGGNPVNNQPFTGFIREVYISGKAYDDNTGLISQRNRLVITKDVSKSLVFYAPLNEGYGSKLRYENAKQLKKITNGNLKWETDHTPLNLCPAGLTSTKILPNGTACCEESFLYLNGHDGRQFSLTLPAPQTAWTNKGTVCMYLYIATGSAIFTKTLFEWSPFAITFSYSGTTITISAKHGSTQYVSKEFAYTGGAWEGVCVTFEVLAGDTRFEIMEAVGHYTDTGNAGSVLSFTPTNEVKLFEDAASYPVYVKNVLILKKVITWDELDLLYWTNVELATSITSVLAFWKLNEAGEFKDLVGGEVLSRDGSVSPSYKVYLGEVHMARYNGYSTLTDYSYLSSWDSHIEDSTAQISVALAVDFGDVSYRRYVWPFITSSYPAYPLIKNSQIHLPPAQYTPFHGLVFPSAATYANTYNSIVTEIAEGGVALWLFKTSSVSAIILSGWSTSSTTSFTLSVIGGTIKVSVLALPPTSLGITLSENKWHHLLYLWRTDAINSIFKVVAVIDGTSKGWSDIDYSPSSIDVTNNPKLLLGATFSADDIIDTGSVFDGYMRKIELLDISKLIVSWSAVTNLATKLASKSIATTGCDSNNSACTFCDSTILQCLPISSPNKSPNGSLACPSHCLTDNCTGCDNEGECTVCKDPMCLSCLGDYCFQCKAKSLLGNGGKCVCDTHFAMNPSTNLCEECDSSCSTCSKPGHGERCTSCPLGKLLLPTGYASGGIPQGRCVEACPQGATADTQGVCHVNCHHTCRTCSEGAREDKCTSCAGARYLVGRGEGRCLSACPTGFAYSTTFECCLPCHYSCATCVSPDNSTGCLTCNSSSPYKTVLYPTTIGSCRESCLEQDNSTYEDPVGKMCYPDGQCPITTYKNEELRLCQPCDSSCFGCSAANDSSKCKGCISPTMFLRLPDTNANSGTCVESCDPDDIVDLKIRVCMPKPDTTSKKQAEAVTQAVSSATTAFTFTGLFSSLLMNGNVGALTAILGPLQMMNLFSIINIPRMPVKLGTFYEGMGIVSFEFLPNLITCFLSESIVRANDPDNELEDNASYNASLEGKLFLVNIGNTMTLFVLIGIYAAVTIALAPKFSFFQRQKPKLKSFVLEFVVINYLDILVCSLIQNRYTSFVNYPFYTTSCVLALLFTICLGLLIPYVWYVLYQHKDRLDSEEVKEQIGCFYEEYKTEGWAKWSAIAFLVLRLIATLCLVLFNLYPYAQVGTYLAFNVLALTWSVFTRPQESKLMLIGAITSDVATVIANGVYIKLCEADLTESKLELYGDLVFYIYISAAGINVLLGMAKCIVDFFDWCKPGKAYLKESCPGDSVVDDKKVPENSSSQAVHVSDVTDDIMYAPKAMVNPDGSIILNTTANINQK